MSDYTKFKGGKLRLKGGLKRYFIIYSFLCCNVSLYRELFLSCHHTDLQVKLISLTEFDYMFKFYFTCLLFGSVLNYEK